MKAPVPPDLFKQKVQREKEQEKLDALLAKDLSTTDAGLKKAMGLD